MFAVAMIAVVMIAVDKGRGVPVGVTVMIPVGVVVFMDFPPVPVDIHRALHRHGDGFPEGASLQAEHIRRGDMKTFPLHLRSGGVPDSQAQGEKPEPEGNCLRREGH
jgi:hypothetical protein